MRKPYLMHKGASITTQDMQYTLREIGLSTDNKCLLCKLHDMLSNDSSSLYEMQR